MGVGLFVALIDQDADTRVDDLAVLDENGVGLRRSKHVELETGEPDASFQVVDRPHPGNLQHAEGCLIWENRLDIVGDDAAIVRLGEVRHRPGRPIMDELAGRATAQSQSHRHDIRTHSKTILLPTAWGCFWEVLGATPRPNISSGPKQ